MSSYNFTTIGSYPTEVYQFSFNNSAFGSFNGIKIPIYNLLKWVRQPSNDAIGYLLPQISGPKTASQASTTINNRILYYDNTSNQNYYKFADDTVQNYNGVIIVEPSNTLQIDGGLVANGQQYVQFDTGTLRSYFSASNVFQYFEAKYDIPNNNSYAFLFYPAKLILNPTSVVKTSDTQWTLYAQTQIRNAYYKEFNGQNTSVDAFNFHNQQILHSSQNFNYTDIGSVSYKLIYNVNLCGVISYRSVYQFPDTKTQLSNNTKTFNIGNNNTVPYVDTTYVSFSGYYINSDNQNSGVSQQKIDYYSYNSSFSAYASIDAFATTEIVYYDPTDLNYGNSQTFQLIQGAISNSSLLGDINNAALSLQINLANGVGTFYNNSNSTFKTYGAPGTNVYMDAIYKTGGSSTVSAQYGSTNLPLNTKISTSTIGNNTIQITTNYPPYCYSYDTTMVDNNNKYIDSDNLNFYLSLEIDRSNPTATNIEISPKIISNYNTLSYELSAIAASTDKISYEIVDASSPDVLNAIINGNGFAFSNNNTLYTLGQKIPVSNPKISILYNQQIINFGGIWVDIRATITSTATQIDSYERLRVYMGQLATNDSATYNIYLEKLFEASNEVVIDASLNNTTLYWPNVDLTNSTIAWAVTSNDPRFDSNQITIQGVDSNLNSLGNSIPNGAYIGFGNNTQTVIVKGFGPFPTTITLSSFKYGISQSINTSPNQFNYLSPGIFSVVPTSSLLNKDKIRKQSFKVQVPFDNTHFDIPAKTPIYWDFLYNGSSNNIPVTAYHNGIKYIPNTLFTADVISAIDVFVEPSYNTYPKLNKLEIKVRSDITYPPISGSYIMEVDDFPDPSIFGSDFYGYYQNNVTNGLDISYTKTERNTITRPDDTNLNFTFDIDSISSKYQNNGGWYINDVYTSNNHSVDVSMNSYGISSLNVQYVLSDTVATGWTSAHNVSAKTHIYVLDPVVFYKPLEFILYPRFGWIDSEYATLLTPVVSNSQLLYTDPTLPSHYTNFFFPTAYENTRNNTQYFWFSANKDIYSDYEYTNVNLNKTFYLNLSVGLAEVPYDPNDISIYGGIPIKLEAYNNTTFPRSMGISGILIDQSGNISTLSYNNTARTYKSYETDDNFKNSPVIVPYNDVTVYFNPLTLNMDLTAQRTITINQSISTSIPNSPAVVISGTVNYYLSSMFWTVSTSVNAVNGRFDLFTLTIGDPFIPLQSGDLGTEDFYLYAEPYITQQIPPTTFDNYSNSQYPDNRDLWNPINLTLL